MKTENPRLLNKTELASKTCSGQELPTFQEQEEAWVPPNLLAGTSIAKDLTSLHISFSDARVQQHFVCNCAQCATALCLHGYTLTTCCCPCMGGSQSNPQTDKAQLSLQRNCPLAQRLPRSKTFVFNQILSNVPARRSLQSCGKVFYNFLGLVVGPTKSKTSRF